MLSFWQLWLKNLPLTITFEPKAIGLYYYTYLLPVTRPFCWYQYFWPSGLDLDFDLLLQKLELVAAGGISPVRTDPDLVWTESLNGYSRLRGTRANFSIKIRLALLTAAYKLNIFPVPLLMYNSRTIVIISFLSQEYLQVFMYIMCFNVSICFKIGNLYSYCDIITKLVYPPELFRIAGFCTYSYNFFWWRTP